MKNKIDQFFKDKLDGHQLPPSEEAWARVEANLSKKNNVAVWRIAAAILIAGALITVILWSQRADDNQSVIANHLPKGNSTKEKDTPQNSSPEKETVKSAPKKSTITTYAQRRIPKEHNNKSVATEGNEKKRASTEASIAANEQPQSFSKASQDKQEEKIKQEATPSVAIASTHQKSIKLEFTLEDFSSEPPVAATYEVKSSGLKKVWELAREVKNGDGPVREIKNELFARNFNKNKNQ